MKHLGLTALFLTLLLPGALAQESPSMSAGAEQAPRAATGAAFAGIGGERPKDSKTEITATKEATYDNQTSIAEFVGRVIVKDPQFTLTCDRLVVSLRKDRKGLEKAEAQGNVVIVQENSDSTGKTTKAIGRAGSATYIPATGEITLRVWPSVQQGINNQVATEQGTIMVLNRGGKSRTIGSSKTVISDTTEAGAAQ